MKNPLKNVEDIFGIYLHRKKDLINKIKEDLEIKSNNLLERYLRVKPDMKDMCDYFKKYLRDKFYKTMNCWHCKLHEQWYENHLCKASLFPNMKIKMPEHALLTPEEARELFIDVIDEDGYWENMALDKEKICKGYIGPKLDYWEIDEWINKRDESIGELTIKYKSKNEFITYLEGLESEFRDEWEKFIKLDKWIYGEQK